MAGDVIYGKNLAVEGEATTEAFEIHHTGEQPFLGAGNTNGGVEREEGNLNWWGSYRLRGHTPARFPNDSFTFLGAPVNTGDKAVSGTARCSEIRIEWDIRGGEFIRSEVLFRANGALSFGQTAPTDTSIPGSLISKGLYVKLDSATQAHVDFMRLVIRAAVSPYCDSTTNGQIQHKEGDVDAEAIWKISSDDSNDFPTVNQDYVAAFYVTVSTYWELTWMRIAGIVPWKVDRRQREVPVQYLAHARFTCTNGTTLGTIKNPAGATKWPAA